MTRTKEMLRICGAWYNVHYLSCSYCDYKSDTENEMVEHFRDKHEDIIDDCYKND
jgi:hypothetical protein